MAMLFKRLLVFIIISLGSQIPAYAAITSGNSEGGSNEVWTVNWPAPQNKITEDITPAGPVTVNCPASSLDAGANGFIVTGGSPSTGTWIVMSMDNESSSVGDKITNDTLTLSSTTVDDETLTCNYSFTDSGNSHTLQLATLAPSTATCQTAGSGTNAAFSCTYSAN